MNKMNMGICDLLVHVDTKEGIDVVLPPAIALSDRFDAHLDALYTIAPAYVPVYSGMEAPAIAIAQIESMERERIESARAEFDILTGKWDSRINWIAEEGDAPVLVNRHARYHDMVMMRQPGAEELRIRNAYTIDHVLLECGRPVLVIPAVGKFDHIGSRIVVAWNGKRESSRAIHDALPLLEAADAVCVVSLDEPGDIDFPGLELAEHLARHNVKVEIESHTDSKGDIAQQLLKHSSEYAADLLVMGAYGHSRLREIILGGATRHILERMTLPVLMSH